MRLVLLVIKNSLLFLSLVTAKIQAQSEGLGLGNYRIGHTTPDSLTATNFREQEQSFVKGTIALPCTHIRTFRAAEVNIAGVLVADVVLYFYDNTLFKLSCLTGNALNESFVLKNGEGISEPESQVRLCSKGQALPMSIWRKSWRQGNNLAVMVHARGYNAACQLDEVNRLLLVNQHMAALASDCELINTLPFTEGFDNLQNNR